MDTQPKDQTQWDLYLDNCTTTVTTPKVTKESHAEIFPTTHQLAGVANIIARSYLYPLHASNYSPTLLQDDVGIGKTLQCVMVITLLNYYHDKFKAGNPNIPATATPWKAAHFSLFYQVSILVSTDLSTDAYRNSEITAMPVR